MQSYTKEFLTQGSTKSKGSQNKYMLRGAIIHQGSAESGHYYSLIKNNEQWFEFNDTEISQFDEKLMPEVAFGGSMDRQHANRSAYILFYENMNYREAQEAILLSHVSVEEVTETKAAILGQENWELIQHVISSHPMHELASNLQDQPSSSLDHFKFITSYFGVFLVRSNRHQALPAVFHYLTKMVDQNTHAAAILISSVDNSGILAEFLVTCPTREISLIVGKILEAAILSLASHWKLLSREYKSTLTKFARRIFNQIGVTAKSSHNFEHLLLLLIPIVSIRDVNGFLRSIDFELLFDILIHKSAKFTPEFLPDPESYLFSPIRSVTDYSATQKSFDSSTSQTNLLSRTSLSIEIACGFYSSLVCPLMTLERLKQSVFWCDLLDQVSNVAAYSKLAAAFVLYSKFNPEIIKKLLDSLKIQVMNYKAVLFLFKALLIEFAENVTPMIIRVLENTINTNSFHYGFFDLLVHFFAEVYLFVPGIVKDINQMSKVISKIRSLNKETGSVRGLLDQNVSSLV